MIDLQSIIVYVGLLLCSFFLASFAEKRNKKSIVWMVILILSLVAGLRNETVGIDTKTYSIVFNLVADGHIRAMYGIEKGFIQICGVLLKICESNQFLFFVIALITNGLIVFKLWEEKSFISFKWSLFSYFVLFYSFSLNGMRQMLAVAIIFYGTKYIKNGKYIYYLILVLLASIFHTSAIIGVVYLFFELIFTKYFKEKRKLYALLLVILSGLIGMTLIADVLSLYSKYLQSQPSQLGLMVIVKVILLLCSYLIIKVPKDSEHQYLSYSYRWNYFVGLVLNSLNYFFFYLGRIGIYFYIYESMFIGHLFKLKNKNYYILLFKLIYLILMVYYLFEMLSKGAHGEIPYRFFWQ